MKNLLIISLLIACHSTEAQYYYKDVIGTKETGEQMKKLVAAKIKSVTLTSYDADGSFTEDFFVQQVVNQNPYSLKTITRSDVTQESVLTSSFDDQLRLIKTIDSAGSLLNISMYQYDTKGNISNIKSWTVDSTNTISGLEEHEWIYKENGRIHKLLRKKNSVPADEIIFLYDEAGNLIEEQTMKNGKIQDNLYYYYNDKNLLTDIVRYNSRVRRLLPDYMFEYSPAGQVIQKITVPGNSADYFIWRYQYDTRGLKIKEACYNKSKDLLARIDYKYNISQ